MISKIWTGTLLFLAWMFFCAWLVLVCREKNVHPLRDFAMFLKKRTKTGRIIFGSLFIALWVFASVKPGDGLRNANTIRTITVADFERGFVQTRVGAGEQFDFTPPPNATIVSDWRAFGAETDWIYVAFTNWAFRVATNDVERLRIYAFGKIEPFIREADSSIATNYWFAPFMASLGVVPQTNWNWLAGSDTPGNVVFVHGYNMAEDAETPLWAKNVFKKLWWAGLDRGFIAVQWRGNEGQYYQVGYGWVSPNYYGNVQNAFATASALKTAMDGVDGPKWFVAHSLGNMLARLGGDSGLPDALREIFYAERGGCNGSIRPFKRDNAAVA